MKRNSLIIFGIILVLTEISGIPGSWKTNMGLIVGVLVIIISFRLRKKENQESRLTKNDDRRFLDKEDNGEKNARVS